MLLLLLLLETIISAVSSKGTKLLDDGLRH
jgi:hypothetical protein